MVFTHETCMLMCTFFLGLMGLAFHRTHFLSALLSLEAMMLSVFIGLGEWGQEMGLLAPMVLPLLMLTMSACEAGLGLALLTSMARSHGSDKLNSLNLLQC